MQYLDNCLLLDNSRASSNCPCLNGNFVAIDFKLAIKNAVLYVLKTSDCA